MPSSETPINLNEPKGPAESSQKAEAPAPDGELRPLEPDEAPRVARGSRWIDYDTHELLEMITQLEDERRWARLREGIWIAILIHLALLSAVTWIPRYVFKVPPVVDRNALNQHKDFTYIDSPPEPLTKAPPKVVIKPVPQKPVTIDKQTLEAMNRTTRPPAPAPAAQPAAPAAAPPPPPAPVNQLPCLPGRTSLWARKTPASSYAMP